jgi:hypothetical protein
VSISQPIPAFPVVSLVFCAIAEMTDDPALHHSIAFVPVISGFW